MLLNTKPSPDNQGSYLSSQQQQASHSIFSQKTHISQLIRSTRIKVTQLQIHEINKSTKTTISKATETKNLSLQPPGYFEEEPQAVSRRCCPLLLADVDTQPSIPHAPSLTAQLRSRTSSPIDRACLLCSSV